MEINSLIGTKKWKVYVENGNNHTLIKTLLNQRFWIEISPTIEEDTIFIWSPQKHKEAHSRQKNSIVRHV